jgi:hypothetical protein
MSRLSPHQGDVKDNTSRPSCRPAARVAGSTCPLLVTLMLLLFLFAATACAPDPSGSDEVAAGSNDGRPTASFGKAPDTAKDGSKPPTAKAASTRTDGEHPKSVPRGQGDRPPVATDVNDNIEKLFDGGLLIILLVAVGLVLLIRLLNWIMAVLDWIRHVIMHLLTLLLLITATLLGFWLAWSTV